MNDSMNDVMKDSMNNLMNNFINQTGIYLFKVNNQNTRTMCVKSIQG